MPLSDDRMPTLQGKYKVPHFDAKGEADRFFRDAGVPTTFLLTSFYWDNFVHFGSGPKKGPDGELPADPADGRRRRWPGIAAEDIGRCAYGVFKGGAEHIGQTIGIAGEHLTGDEMAAALTHARSARPCATTTVAPAALPQLRLPRRRRPRQHVPGLSRLRRRAEQRRATSPVRSGLNPALQDFDAWLAANATAIPLD